jgi:hypothetical protein
MKITLDTEKDSIQQIRAAIELLQHYIEGSSYPAMQSTNLAHSTNLVDAADSSTGYVDLFGNTNQQESKHTTTPVKPESSSTNGGIFAMFSQAEPSSQTESATLLESAAIKIVQPPQIEIIDPEPKITKELLDQIETFY